MSTPEMADGIKGVAFFRDKLHSLNQFNEMEVNGVINNLISPSGRDVCFMTTYYRSCSNVASMLEFTDVKHFQAIAMLARSLFELAVDIELINLVPNAVAKMAHYPMVERLQAARNIVAFEAKHTLSLPLDTTSSKALISIQGPGIDSIKKSLWTRKELER